MKSTALRVEDATAAADRTSTTATATFPAPGRFVHVCISKPCAFCAVMSGEPLPASSLIQIISDRKRRLVGQIDAELTHKSEQHLESILYIIEGLPDEKPERKPRRNRPELVYSSPVRMSDFS